MLFKILCVLLNVCIFVLYRTVMDTGSHIAFDSFASVCATSAIVFMFCRVDDAINSKLNKQRNET